MGQIADTGEGSAPQGGRAEVTDLGALEGGFSSLLNKNI